MKRQVIVEIEYPDEFDNCWDADESGMQTYRDTIGNYAVAECMQRLMYAIEDCEHRGIVTEEDKKADPDYQWVLARNRIVRESRAVGYITDEGEIRRYNRETSMFT